MLANAFEDFIEKLDIDNIEDIHKKFKRITKRLNEAYWGIENDEEHGYIVGSLGRQTAIKGVSDLDMLFVLPDHIKQQYDQHEGNGQSKLLQNVKKEIKETYPRTTVRGDGQVVVINLDSINYQIEVCPVFVRSDGAFNYPDSNNGGSWKKTDPLPEMDRSLITADETNGHYRNLCNIIRAWKNSVGFKFGGLLIDTLIYNFIEENTKYKNTNFTEYLQLLKDLFNYLKTRNKEQKYWFALGSNQKVYNKKGTFVTKAESAYDKLKDLTEESDDLYLVLQEVLGSDFPVPEQLQQTALQKSATFSLSANIRMTEEFVEKKFPVDIRYYLKIDCEVNQNGFREYLLRALIRARLPLLSNKKLRFFIEKNELEDISMASEEPISYDIYWKVLNKGPEAIKRDCIRGQIVADLGRHQRLEETSFRGEHIVECYIVLNGTVVAKDRILVPISTNVA
ncbi:nucleotidyltransferase [Paenibacillus sp. BC26]|uniref:nucleotide-binding domain-containing protein n=1 Tax=Paenibacillus sp. BC26 TaxID=1881032 RepID=UPI0008F1DA4C|nr:nucleotidyltransferase [Paenibacillus sp. BC26]SFS83892.1 hypothetical protein SAMN05428962_3169 [Paenibacillus sp. BC26]